MPTCKDCLHLEVCEYFKADLPYCVEFKDSTEWVERPKGRWKYYHKRNIAVCTNCSFERKLDADFGNAITCPNCGADMRGESE